MGHESDLGPARRGRDRRSPSIRRSDRKCARCPRARARAYPVSDGRRGSDARGGAHSRRWRRETSPAPRPRHGGANVHRAPSSGQTQRCPPPEAGRQTAWLRYVAKAHPWLPDTSMVHLVTSFSDGRAATRSSAPRPGGPVRQDVQPAAHRPALAEPETARGRARLPKGRAGATAAACGLTAPLAECASEASRQRRGPLSDEVPESRGPPPRLGRDVAPRVRRQRCPMR